VSQFSGQKASTTKLKQSTCPPHNRPFFILFIFYFYVPNRPLRSATADNTLAVLRNPGGAAAGAACFAFEFAAVVDDDDDDDDADDFLLLAARGR
jgi:hypothetical protein